MIRQCVCASCGRTFRPTVPVALCLLCFRNDLMAGYRPPKAEPEEPTPKGRAA